MAQATPSSDNLPQNLLSFPPHPPSLRHRDRVWLTVTRQRQLKLLQGQYQPLLHSTKIQLLNTSTPTDPLTLLLTAALPPPSCFPACKIVILETGVPNTWTLIRSIVVLVSRVQWRQIVRLKSLFWRILIPRRFDWAQDKRTCYRQPPSGDNSTLACRGEIIIDENRIFSFHCDILSGSPVSVLP